MTQIQLDMIATHCKKPGLDAVVSDRRTTLKTRSGVWRDIAVRYRKTEVDYHSGLALVIGDRHGLQLPLTRQVVRMIHELEDGQRQMGRANIALLESIRSASGPSRPQVGGRSDPGRYRWPGQSAYERRSM